MILRYRFRWYPTPAQARTLAQTFGACRYVYNWALRYRRDAYQAGRPVHYAASSAALTALKRQPDHAWLKAISCVPTQQALRHLQTAFANFFAHRSRYPRFKTKRGQQSAEYTRSAFKWAAARRHLTVAKLGRLDVRWSRPFTSAPSTVTITKDRAGRYFVTLCLDEPVAPLPKTGTAIGVDLGVRHLATLSSGERIDNPQPLKRQLRKLKRLQRVLARRVPGSQRRERARRAVARLQAQIADTRLDHLHKVTTDLVRRFDRICVEDLHVRGMVRQHPLARALADAAFGQFVRLLDYKCRWYAKTLVKVDRFFPSSKLCSACGHVLKDLPLSVREWICPQCGTRHDRDANAALNLLAAGHAERQNAQGGHVRPARVSSRTSSAPRTANHPVDTANATSRVAHVSSGISPLKRGEDVN